MDELLERAAEILAYVRTVHRHGSVVVRVPGRPLRHRDVTDRAEGGPAVLAVHPREPREAAWVSQRGRRWVEVPTGPADGPADGPVDTSEPTDA